MNVFVDYKLKIHDVLLKLQKEQLITLPTSNMSLTVELPPKGQDAHMSCNVAMILSKYNKKNPVDLATDLSKLFTKNFNEFEKINVSKPGFINFYFKVSIWKKYLSTILSSADKYGSNIIKKKKYNVEFVSANPTGPLHVGHCRGAILGDVISNLLIFNGHEVTREYYVNDYGSQIDKFTHSVYYRILEIISNKDFPNDSNLYPGDYIIDIAKSIINEKKIINFTNLENINESLRKESLNHSIKLIINNLKLLGIKHDNFVYESDLIKKNAVSETIKKLEKNKHIYKGKLKPPKGEIDKNWIPRSQLLFKSTKFGDDTDRALQKSDGTWTYFAGDIAYHSNKLDRNFDLLINILGADHAGYIKRIRSAVTAMSNSKVDLLCKVSQLVKLYKNGNPYKMSKRKGDYISVEDLTLEVGIDSVRFMMLSRSNDVELDFDFDKVTEKSKENPVFYVQYAQARINSIFRILNKKIDSKIDVDDSEFILNVHEIEIMKKILQWPSCVDLSVHKLEPHRIPFYLYDLVTLFHSYWNLGNENKDFRFITDEGKHNPSRLILLQALSVVIRNGMNILGVSTPDKM